MLLNFFSQCSISGDSLVKSACSTTMLFFSTTSNVDFVFRANCSIVLQVSHQSAVKSINTVLLSAKAASKRSSLNGFHGNSVSPVDLRL